jgi:hypothetical protein
LQNDSFTNVLLICYSHIVGRVGFGERQTMFN